MAVTGCHSAEESLWVDGLVVGGRVRVWPSQWRMAGAEVRALVPGSTYGFPGCVCVYRWG